MSKRWIVVAESALARIVEDDGRNVRELPSFTHPESRAHVGDLRTGGKGDVIESTGASSHQPEPSTTTGEKHGDIFAKEVAQFLSRSRSQHDLDTIVLVAEPKFLGRMRDKLDAPTEKIVTAAIHKDWTREYPAEIRRRVNAMEY